MKLHNPFKKHRPAPPPKIIRSVKDLGHSWQITAEGPDAMYRFNMPKVHPVQGAIYPEPKPGVEVNGPDILMHSSIRMWYMFMEGKWWNIPTLIGDQL